MSLNSFKNFRRLKMSTVPLVGATLLTLCITVQATGINCSEAKTLSDAAICADRDLVNLDAQVARLYAEVKRQPGMLALQKNWLSKTQACSVDVSCLKYAYTTRVAELRASLKALQAYKPDAVDERALAELRHAVERQLEVNGERGLERALALLSFKSGRTVFQNVGVSSETSTKAGFPTRRPSGVTPNEWQALNRSTIEADGENGSVSYTLLDLDGDGARDLIIDAYSGGTGLWTRVYVLRRQGDRFISPLSRIVAETATSGDDELYTLNGRGANQGGNWVKLQGRIYLAYFEGQYGQDRVSLLRPLRLNASSPTLIVRYAYTLSISRRQKSEDRSTSTLLSDSQHAALTKGLATLTSSTSLIWADPSLSGKPLCPVPANTSEDEQASYSSFGPGHYTYEIVGDFPVWYGKSCHIGRLVNWFGSYSKQGLAAMLSVRKADGSGAEESFGVTGRRRVSGVESRLTGYPKPLE